MKKYNYIHIIIHFLILFFCVVLSPLSKRQKLCQSFLYHNETHFLKYLCFLNNYSNMKEEKNFSTIIFSFANTFDTSFTIIFLFSKSRTILDLTSGGEFFRVYDLRSEFVTSALLNASSNHREGTPETKRDR